LREITECMKSMNHDLINEALEHNFKQKSSILTILVQYQEVYLDKIYSKLEIDTLL
jgi:hypothetical protein